MRHFYTILFSILSLSTFGQELTKGVIMPGPGWSFDSYVYIPTSGLSAYNKPGGKKIAQIQLGKPDVNGDIFGAFIKVNEEVTEYSNSNFDVVGYDVIALIYTDIRDKFVRTNNGYWLSIDELASECLHPITWMDYLINREDVLGWYANDPGLNLRTGPSTTSDIILTLKGDLFDITPTQEVKGLWCKVKVTEYREHPCLGDEDLIIRTLSGWVKLLSDDQKPNVWCYDKGC